MIRHLAEDLRDLVPGFLQISLAQGEQAAQIGQARIACHGRKGRVEQGLRLVVLPFIDPQRHERNARGNVAGIDGQGPFERRGFLPAPTLGQQKLSLERVTLEQPRIGGEHFIGDRRRAVDVAVLRALILA